MAAVCAPNPCDASAAPANGSAAGCGASLAGDYTSNYVDAGSLDVIGVAATPGMTCVAGQTCGFRFHGFALAAGDERTRLDGAVRLEQRGDIDAGRRGRKARHNDDAACRSCTA